MGCHTWFYMKMKHQPSEEEVKKICLDVFRKNWSAYVDLMFHKYDVSKCTKETQEEITEYYWAFENILDEDKNVIDNRNRLEEEFLESMNSYRLLKHIGIVDDYMMEFFEYNWTPEGWPEDVYPHIKHYNGVFYQECDENYQTIFHDLFRVDDYPDTILHNYDEYLEFVNNPKNNAHLNRKDDSWEWVHNRMKEFWEKYSDGIVIFG